MEGYMHQHSSWFFWSISLALAAVMLGLGSVYAQEQQTSSAGQYVGSETCQPCHEEIFSQFQKTPHNVTLTKKGYKAEQQGCEGCHGPGGEHVEGGGDSTKIASFKTLSSKQRSETCLKCHAKQDERINFKHSEHQISQVSCDACHSSHSPKFAVNLLREETTTLCFSCHGEIRNSFSLPFHHKVTEGVISCTDCHNQHGGFSAQKRLVGTDLSCIKCHSDKQGPFTFEHMAVRIEGCTYCHSPHGSNNPRLLTRNTQTALCLECHSGAGRLPIGGETPSFHNLATARFQNCTTCHTQIHGSNLNQVFFE
jgi:DmsE family decaheme c-type cytochrome